MDLAVVRICPLRQPTADRLTGLGLTVAEEQGRAVLGEVRAVVELDAVARAARAAHEGEEDVDLVRRVSHLDVELPRLEGSAHLFDGGARDSCRGPRRRHKDDHGDDEAQNQWPAAVSLHGRRIIPDPRPGGTSISGRTGGCGPCPGGSGPPGPPACRPGSRPSPAPPPTRRPRSRTPGSPGPRPGRGR